MLKMASPVLISVIGVHVALFVFGWVRRDGVGQGRVEWDERQEAPEGPRRLPEASGGHRRHQKPQETPRGTRRPQEDPGGTKAERPRRPQEAPGGHGRPQKTSGGRRRRSLPRCASIFEVSETLTSQIITLIRIDCLKCPRR